MSNQIRINICFFMFAYIKARVTVCIGHK